MGQEVDPHSRNLDYLLEDDEESGSGRGGWIVALLLALALAGGLGYWHYRNGGWPGAKSSTPTSSERDAAANPSTAGDNTVSAPAAAASASSAAPPPATAALTDVHPQNPSAPMAASPEAPSGDKPAPAAGTATPASEAGKHSPAEAPAAPVKHAAAARADVPVKAEDPVTLGEKYLYGRGLPQSCERGLKLVRPAADASNGKAMITMGALYATGHCVSRDLPTAYRYFALALRKDPDNAALKQNAEMVWGQMTQSERQQAIRLTQ
jgi:TPR repeat protein